jgi:hypothetical protein
MDREDVHHLVQARWHVARGVCFVADQRARREKLRFGGHPTELADEFLDVLERTLTLMVRHRDQLETHSR